MEPCLTTWHNYTGESLPAGGEFPVQITSEECAELCAYERPDCIAVQYSHGSGYCVVHTNDVALDYMTPAHGVDVYMMIKCNETGIRVY